MAKEKSAKALLEKENRKMELVGKRRKVLEVLRECGAWLVSAAVTSALILLQMFSAASMENAVSAGAESGAAIEAKVCACWQHWLPAVVIIVLFVICHLIYHFKVYKNREKNREKKRLNLRFLAAAGAYSLFQAAYFIWYGFPKFQGVSSPFITLLYVLYLICALYPSACILIYALPDVIGKKR